MRTRIIAAAAIVPAALVILIALPPAALAVTISFICAVAAYELTSAAGNICKETPSPRAAVYAAVAAVMIPFAVYAGVLLRGNSGAASSFTGNALFIGVITVFFILICLLLIDLFLTIKSEARIRWQQYLALPAAALIIPLMLSSLIMLRVQPPGEGTDAEAEAAQAAAGMEATEGSLPPAVSGADIGRVLVILPIVITVFTDSGAYFTGVAIGKHKPLPKISPNKTVEGFIGGFVSGIAAVFVYGLIINSMAAYTVNLPLLLIYGAAGAVITEAGDIVFSVIKRKCKIKDFGKIIPGHGGFLDRFDSLIFTAPAMLALFLLLPAFM